MLESGHIQSFNKDGQKLTLEQDESYEELKKRTPADFRKITTEVKAVAIDEALARRITIIWERMLLGLHAIVRADAAVLKKAISRVEKITKA